MSQLEGSGSPNNSLAQTIDYNEDPFAGMLHLFVFFCFFVFFGVFLLFFCVACQFSKKRKFIVGYQQHTKKPCFFKNRRFSIVRP